MSDRIVPPVQPVSAAAIVPHAAWLLCISVAASLLLFVAPRTAGPLGGIVPSLVLWALLWLGLVDMRRPRIVPGSGVLAIVGAGFIVILLAPSVGEPTFVLVAALLWVVLLAGFLESRSTLLLEADRTVVRSWLSTIAGRPRPLVLPPVSALRLIVDGGTLRLVHEGASYTFGLGRHPETLLAALAEAGLVVAGTDPPMAVAAAVAGPGPGDR